MRNENVNELQNQQSCQNAVRQSLRLFQIDKVTGYCLTIWFWRLKRKDGSKYHSRSISISWLRKIWKINGVKPMYKITTNGATKENKDSCFDGSIYFGYAIFGYTNWSFCNVA